MQLDWSPLITPYWAEPIKELVRPHAGLYVIWSWKADDTWSCTYIGNSDCLLIDMTRHLVSTTWEPLITKLVTQTKSGFSFALVESPMARAGAAKHLHDVLRPRFGADPGGAAMIVNLPEQRVVEKPRPERRVESEWVAKGAAKAGAKAVQSFLREWLGIG